MLRTLRMVVALLVVGCAAAAYADPPERVGRLNYITGSASFASGEAPDEWVQAVLNRPLTSGDRLWVDRDGRAEFHVGSAAVRMGAYTAVDVLNLDDDRLQLRLAEGALNVRVRDLDPNDIVEIATPAGAVLLRQPGSYRISVDAQRDLTRVVANFGQAEVVTPGQSFVVPSSQAAVVAVGAAPSFEVAAYATGDELDRWSAERDRREDRVVSSRYVSREMTGYEDLDQHGSWRSVPEYGNVWVPASVPTGWAPYRQGHWVWISPWGWTWVDDAPWGFAPFHYGRWVWVDRYWAWAPGPVVRRPAYAPALVAFVGGSSWSVSVTSGPAVGWFPLGWREPFIPWYRATPRYVQNVNVTHVTSVTNVTTINYVNRSRPDAVTVVTRDAFVSSRPAWHERHRVAPADLARAEIIRERVPADPVRASFVSERPGRQPPAEVRAREVVAVNPPPQPSRDGPESRERRGFSSRPSDADQPRVRVISRDRAEFSGQAQNGAPALPPPRSQDEAGVRANRQGERRIERDDRRDVQRDERRPTAGFSRPREDDAARRAQDDAARRGAEERDRRAQQEVAARAQADAATRAQSEQRDRERRDRAQQENAARAQADAVRAQAEQRDREARARNDDRGEGGRNRQERRVERAEPAREAAVRQPSPQMQQPAPQPQQPRAQQPQPQNAQAPQQRQPAGDEMSASDRRAQRQQSRRNND